MTASYAIGLGARRDVRAADLVDAVSTLHAAKLYERELSYAHVQRLAFKLAGRDAVTGLKTSYKGRIAEEMFIKLGQLDYAAELAQIRALKPDFLFSFYYRNMLTQTVLDTAKRGALNMHGSLLPKYRGRAPISARAWPIGAPSFFKLSVPHSTIATVSGN